MKELSIDEVNQIIDRINRQCNDYKVKEQLQLIQDRLNSKNSLRLFNSIENFKNSILMLIPRYRKKVESNKIHDAMSEIQSIVEKNIITPKLFKDKVIKGYPSELGRIVDTYLDLEYGVEFNEENNSLKRLNID